jgi:hypothetical protein
MNYKDKDVIIFCVGAPHPKIEVPFDQPLKPIQHGIKSDQKSHKILEYIILYNFPSTLKFSDFSRHFKVGLWSGEKQCFWCKNAESPRGAHNFYWVSIVYTILPSFTLPPTALGHKK